MNSLGPFCKGAVAVCVVMLTAACGSLPREVAKPPSHAISESSETDLGALAARHRPFKDSSGARVLKTGASALDARLGLIAAAQQTLDLQYYQFQDDAVGSRVLHALRDAARRQVRVRLLVDDLYTSGSERALRALANEPNVEVRLFNPFSSRGGGVVSRYLGSLFDFERVNARMHNKTFIADGAFAVVGGRNIAEAYFEQSGKDAFIDLDLLVAGKAVSGLQDIFDIYWNSDLVYPIQSIVHDVASRSETHRDLSHPVIGLAELEHQVEQMRWGWAQAFADAPRKAFGERRLLGSRSELGASGVRALVWTEMSAARSEYVIVTPYLIPGDGGMRAVRENRQRGVRIQILTNSLASTDEPLVHMGYRRYRSPMVKEGVELYELAADRGWTLLSEGRREGQQVGLHTKCVVFDRDTVFIGSLNFDPRSEATNTETGVVFRSPDLSEDILELIDSQRQRAYRRIHIDARGQTVWDAPDAEPREAPVGAEPGSSWWQRFKLDLLTPFVSERLL